MTDKSKNFGCRGRDSNPHGAFAPGDFKSFKVIGNHLKLLSFSLLLCETVQVYVSVLREIRLVFLAR